MLSQDNVRSITRNTEQPFNVIEAFASLSVQRKRLLCDSLFSGHKDSFRHSVNMLWPTADNTDVKKLEGFLNLLKKTVY